jgi:hypothetical protein
MPRCTALVQRAVASSDRWLADHRAAVAPRCGYRRARARRAREALHRVLRIDVAVEANEPYRRQFAPRHCWAFCRTADLFTPLFTPARFSDQRRSLKIAKSHYATGKSATDGRSIVR